MFKFLLTTPMCILWCACVSFRFKQASPLLQLFVPMGHSSFHSFHFAFLHFGKKPQQSSACKFTVCDFTVHNVFGLWVAVHVVNDCNGCIFCFQPKFFHGLHMIPGIAQKEIHRFHSVLANPFFGSHQRGTAGCFATDAFVVDAVGKDDARRFATTEQHSTLTSGIQIQFIHC
jgi:hypothetical protein